MYITNNPTVALIAEKSGVDRIWVDLETIGKEERQKNINSVKSHHTVQDINKLAQVLTRAELMVRVNPWSANSALEIEKVIAAGAQRIMLPMWKREQEANAFLRTVNKRVKTTLLLETKEGVECLDEVLKNPLVDEIHIGLNDLHLSYGLTFMFELLANGTVEALGEKLKKAKIPYGFGGIARIGEGMVPSEKIIMEHYRLGSTRAILSRSFCNVDLFKNAAELEKFFTENMQRLRKYEEGLKVAKEREYLFNQKEVKNEVRNIVARLKKGAK